MRLHAVTHARTHAALRGDMQISRSPNSFRHLLERGVVIGIFVIGIFQGHDSAIGIFLSKVSGVPAGRPEKHGGGERHCAGLGVR